MVWADEYVGTGVQGVRTTVLVGHYEKLKMVWSQYDHRM